MAVENFEDTKIALDNHLKNILSAVKRKNISENNRKALDSNFSFNPHQASRQEPRNCDSKLQRLCYPMPITLIF